MEQPKNIIALKEEYTALYWQHKKELDLLKQQHKVKMEKLENRLNKKANIESVKSRKARSRFLIKFGAEILACFGVHFKEVDFLKNENEANIVAAEMKQSILVQIRSKQLYYYGENDKLK